MTKTKANIVALPNGTLTTVEDRIEIEPFAVLVPEGWGRDSGQRWFVQYVTKHWRVERDGFGRLIFDESSYEFRAYGRKLTKVNNMTGAQHLLPWFHDEERLLAAKLTSPGWQRPVAAQRRETEPCQAGTPGCSVDHAQDDGECETW